MVASMNDRTWTEACADCCLAAVVVAAAVGLLLAATLALVVLAGVGMRMLVAYELPLAFSSLRAYRRLVTAMRRDLRSARAWGLARSAAGRSSARRCTGSGRWATGDS
jgi:hypothetical protein